jgi:hypothetical protein
MWCGVVWCGVMAPCQVIATQRLHGNIKAETALQRQFSNSFILDVLSPTQVASYLAAVAS